MKTGDILLELNTQIMWFSFAIFLVSYMLLGELGASILILLIFLPAIAAIFINFDLHPNAANGWVLAKWGLWTFFWLLSFWFSFWFFIGVGNCHCSHQVGEQTLNFLWWLLATNAILSIIASLINLVKLIRTF